MAELKGKIALCADDDPEILRLVARHLKSLGAGKVIEASDGEEALSLAKEHLPDLVVLDVMMPGMSGWEVCKTLRAIPALADTGIIMLTAIGHSLNEMSSPLYGADDCLDKPFEPDDLTDRIREVVAKRQPKD